MKVMIARLNHETNTFSPVPTPLAAFGNDGPAFGAAAYEENKGKRTAMSAFIDIAEANGASVVTPVSATAYPSGRVDAKAYRKLCDEIVAGARGCGAILLDLHGAMAVESTDDGEGDLLERLRQQTPDVPIAVALDLHGNVTPKMMANADVIVSFKTYPHVDMYETGDHAGRILFDWLNGGPRPVMAWRRLPLMTHTLRSATAQGAMRDAVQAAAQAFEAAGAIVTPMQPWMTPAMLEGVDRFWRTRSAIDLAALPQERRDKILPFIRTWAESGGGQSGEDVFRSYYETMNVRARTVAACAPYDYVLSPVAPVVAYNAEWPSPTNEVATTMHHIGYTLPYNMSEQPAASVNCGYTKAGLPIGLQIAGARFDDLGVLRIARAWETMRPEQHPWPQPPRAA